MQKSSKKLTIAQFAKLHEVNKRTLHYYDSIDLFSPSSKGENNYRYYDVLQSIDFEYIRMLKELHMSMDEIKHYLENPNAKEFIEIADRKMIEMNEQIQSLLMTRKILEAKKEKIAFCNTIDKQKIEIKHIQEEEILTLPYTFENDDLSTIFSYVKKTWDINQIRMGIGSYIAMDNIVAGNFDQYEGLFTIALGNASTANMIKRPSGAYLCGYQRGTWDALPSLYKQMLAYAKTENILLTGYAYEIGLNDFVISKEEDYITQIMIKIKE